MITFILVLSALAGLGWMAVERGWIDGKDHPSSGGNDDITGQI